VTHRVVIADAGPLIGLARIGAFHLLRHLFGRRRLEAKHLGLALIGSAAVIGLAKTEGLIPAARALLDQMVAAGYFIGPSVVSAMLCELGE
jgi:predicted nucleic acid-binding protein